MSRESDENHIWHVVQDGLRRWLGKARAAVMAPWQQHNIQPSPVAIFSTQSTWNDEVETILSELGKIAFHAWSQATDVPVVSRHAFVMSQLAQTENLLVRIPDEVYNHVFAAITDAVNAGKDTAGVADAVNGVLEWTGSENWPRRARVIAITETTRAYGAGTLGAGMEQSRVTGRLLQKRWLTEQDERVRASHRAVDHMTIPLTAMFPVGPAFMLYPGDPMAPVDEVAGCRCDLQIVD